MEFSHLVDAVPLLEKANAELEPELLTVAGARERLEIYARARKLIDYGDRGPGGAHRRRREPRPGHRDVGR